MLRRRRADCLDSDEHHVLGWNPHSPDLFERSVDRVVGEVRGHECVPVLAVAGPHHVP